MGYKDYKELLRSSNVRCLINACPEETGFGTVSSEFWQFLESIVDTRSLKCFYKVDDQHHVALINEYDKLTAERYFDGDWEVMLQAVQKVAQLLSMESSLSDCEIYVGENTGFCNCHELVVLIPYGADTKTANQAAIKVEELAYQFD